MNRITVMAGAIGALVATTPALAQVADPNQPANDGSAAASMTAPPGVVTPGADPGVAAANADVGHALATQTATEHAERASQQRAYHQALAARRQTIARIHATQAEREEAYGRAMDAWHAQVTACHQGNRQACLAPTPNPDDFR
jgi:hypothetical protein